MTKRREFVKKGLLGSTGIAIGMGISAKSYASILGSNDRIHVAVIGIRGQGNGHISNWCKLKDNRNVVLKTICDVDEDLYPDRVKKVIDAVGTTPETEWDMRRVFEDKEIDAVSIATPNH